MNDIGSIPLSTIENQNQNQTSSNHAPSFSSILSSPLATRLSTFTNYMSLSWAPPASQSGVAALRLIPSRSSNEDQGTRVQTAVESKKYVSKENQLEKLRSRLCQETRGPVDFCRSCGDKVVFL
jgi:hypothetical protein